MGRPERGSIVFTAPEGGPISDRNFANRIWFPAIEAAGVRRFPPRIMRHTAASWLVQDGVPLYDVQALLGHESFATTTVCPPGSGRAQQGTGVVGAASWRTSGARAEKGPSLVSRDWGSELGWAWEDLNFRPLPYQGVDATAQVAILTL